MKRKLVAFTTSLLLLFSVLSASHVGAHPIIYTSSLTGTPDRSRAEWFDEAFTPGNNGRDGAKPSAGHSIIARNDLGWGEFIFRDPTSDQRVHHHRADHRNLDRTHVHLVRHHRRGGLSRAFLIKMARIRGALADPPPEFMISVSTDQNGTAGNTQRLHDGVGVTPLPAGGLGA